MLVHSETLNPCKCGSKKKPDLDSDDMVPCWAVHCHDCHQMQYGQDWTFNGAVKKWNAENPIKSDLKYEITPYILEVITKMKTGWTLKRNTLTLPAPISYLAKNGKTESVTEWTITVLWENGLVSSKSNGATTIYKLNKKGKSYGSI
jgi:hypothetical protein